MDKKITALKAQKNNPDRVNVFLDGEFAFGISRFVGVGLIVGQIITPEQIDKLSNLDLREKAYQSALRYIGYKPRTQYEVTKKLESGGYSEETVNFVLDELNQKNYLDDADYAVQWVETRVSSHPRSQRLIRHELKRRGIPETLIEEALEKMPDDREMARTLATGFLEKNKQLDNEKFMNRMKGVLARNGFAFDVINEVIDELMMMRKNS